MPPSVSWLVRTGPGSPPCWRHLPSPASCPRWVRRVLQRTRHSGLSAGLHADFSSRGAHVVIVASSSELRIFLAFRRDLSRNAQSMKPSSNASTRNSRNSPNTRDASPGGRTAPPSVRSRTVTDGTLTHVHTARHFSICSSSGWPRTDFFCWTSPRPPCRRRASSASSP